MPVEKLVGGIYRFQKHVYPKHQDLFENLALGQRPDALFITCSDSRVDPCLLTQANPANSSSAGLSVTSCRPIQT